MSGTSIQCPICHMLADVPLLSDLGNLEDDGTLKLQPEAEDEADREAELKRAFIPRRQDDNGEDYDLRQTFEQVVDAGADHVPLEMKDELRPGAPKYDPVTGELIHPMAMKGDDHRMVLPIPPGPRTLQYQPVDPASATVFRGSLGALLRPGNIVVLVFIFMLHLVVATEFLFILRGLAAVFIFLFIWPHLANVVEEVAIQESDEFPTPLRGLSFVDDLWNPLVHFLGAWFICYAVAPAAIRLAAHFLAAQSAQTAPMAEVVVTLLSLLGSFFFPAVFLTLCTSGCLWNLRPDRVFGVIGICGARYLAMVVFWMVSLATYATAMYAADGATWSIWWVPRELDMFLKLKIVCIPLIFVAICLMHLFARELGMMYRANHEKFPWILQRHISTKPLQHRLPRRPRPVQTVAAVDQVEPQAVLPLESEAQAVTVPAGVESRRQRMREADEGRRKEEKRFENWPEIRDGDSSDIDTSFMQ